LRKKSNIGKRLRGRAGAKLQFYRPDPVRRSGPSSRSALPVPANRVRIIAGQFRGRVVRFPSAPGLRPTPDRVRETLFNWLGQDLEGLATLELYAGTGVLSLEALSRGAARAVAVDRNAALMRALGATGRTFGATGLVTEVADAREWLLRDTGRYDVIFLDPPFADDPWPWLLELAAARVTGGGRIYAEAARPIEAPPRLCVLRRDKAGHVHYHLLARAE
jgi:16S rRNA (guanine966-N2)-methyltransferase